MLRRTGVFVVGLAVIAFAATTQWMATANLREALRERARLCAAALEPARGGDLSDSVARLRSQYDGLVAVATLSPSGHIDEVYPETPAHRSAIEVALTGGECPATVFEPQTGEPIRVGVAAVPLNGVASPAGQQVAILFRENTDGRGWAAALACFTAVVGMTVLSGTSTLRRWFARRVVGPLHDVAEAVQHARKCPDEAVALHGNEWCETARISELYEDLLLDVAKGDARVRCVVRETQRRLHDREAGFDQQLRRAKDRATMDPLTGLRNRSFYDGELEPLFDRHVATKRDLAVVMLDLDNFKQYNDTRGHQAGDALLEFFGALLRGSIRPEDYAIRYGGDEFVLLLPETTLAQAEAIARRLVALFGQYAARLGRKPPVSISAGIASLGCGDPGSGFELVANADAALYAAKRGRKGSVLTHGTPATAARHRNVPAH